jgi:eukaryotic sulfide quinone oxidoreductase
VVATGRQINWSSIPGLSEAFASLASSIYSYDTVDKVWSDIDSLVTSSVFTQPASNIQYPGAPQKIMWMAWDHFRASNREASIKIAFYTGLPTISGVPKYSQALDKLHIQRGIAGYFGHDLVFVESSAHKATFKKGDGRIANINCTLLHIVLRMGPLDIMKGQPISDEKGWVNVDKGTL